ncbi:MAG: hypothetical protein CM15mP92_1690 [Halieaceae bacterium]|nr:MAG: hypothetical protein CM15mP92_1690 [Halieaceae bacterium]
MIDDDFEVSNSRIRARHDSVFQDNPSNLLRVFVLIGNDPLVIASNPIHNACCAATHPSSTTPSGPRRKP